LATSAGGWLARARSRAGTLEAPGHIDLGVAIVWESCPIACDNIETRERRQCACF
jgi:hypothetical protein